MTDRDDLDDLLNSLIGIAQDQQAKRGEFLPFFGTLPAEIGADEQVQLGMYHSEEESITALESREQIVLGLRGQAKDGSIRACALVTDVNLKDGTAGYAEAIHILLEHSSGRVVNFYLPYRKIESGYEYGDAKFEASPPEVFSR